MPRLPRRRSVRLMSLSASEQRLIALIVILVASLAVWLVQWIGTGWIPQGDKAIIAEKTMDVFSAHPPIQGMRSKSAMTVDGVYAHHPGPMQFYLLAIPYALAGWHPAGLLVGSFLIVAAFIALALWQAWKVGRTTGLVITVITIVAVELRVENSLVLPWNVYPPIVGLITLMVLAWRLMRGSSRSLAWFVAVCSFVVQSNLMFVPVLLPLVVTLVAVGLVRWYRWRGAFWPMPGSGSDHDDAPVWRRPGVIAAVIGLLCWLPSIIELFALSPNNADELWKLARGVLSPLLVIAVLALAGLIVACTRWMTPERGRPTRAHTAWCVSALSSVGALGAVVIGGATRAHYATLVMAVPVFAVASVLLRRPARHELARFSLPVVAFVGALMLLAAAMWGPTTGDHTFATTLQKRDVDLARPVVDDTVKALRAHGITRGPVEVRAEGVRPIASTMPATALRLRQEGHEVYTQNIWPHVEEDEFRTARKAPARRTVVMLRDGKPPEVTSIGG